MNQPYDGFDITRFSTGNIDSLKELNSCFRGGVSAKSNFYYNLWHVRNTGGFKNTMEDFYELSQFQLNEDVIGLLPFQFCVSNNVVVLEINQSSNGREAVVGMLHPELDDEVEKVENELGLNVKPVQLNGYEIRRAIARGFETEEEDLEDTPVLALSHDYEISFELDQEATAIIRDFLSEAVKKRASDVHVENYTDDVDLRFRIDGVLHQINTPLSPENVERVISKLKVMAELDITERREDLDGRFQINYRSADGNTRTIDVRISVIPGPSGEDAVMRILDRTQLILELDRLGFENKQLKAYNSMIRSPGGLVLAVGTSGSGKTTTLYAAINEINHEKIKILTAEDPIEFNFDKVNQKQVNDRMSFADYSRAFLRQDPDVIMIGEIRDPDTATISVRAANTGHLVMSTLHTGNAVMAISRMRSLGVDDDYMADVLLGIVSQRLVRIICDNCKVEVEPDEELMEKFYDSKPSHSFYRGEGCEQCDQTGYIGRTGVFEILTADNDLEEMITKGVPTGMIRRELLSGDFDPLYKHALKKVEEGITSLQDVSRVIMPPVSREEDR